MKWVKVVRGTNFKRIKMFLTRGSMQIESQTLNIETPPAPGLQILLLKSVWKQTPLSSVLTPIPLPLSSTQRGQELSFSPQVLIEHLLGTGSVLSAEKPKSLCSRWGDRPARTEGRTSGMSDGDQWN